MIELAFKMAKPLNTSLPYEALVQRIFQNIVDDTDRTVIVRHNVTLQGITLRHQIDVYWEFEHAGILHRTVVQVKDWNKPLHQGELLKFKGVLEDLPGQPRGIVVTRKGYQSGAAEFARVHDISLFELDEWTVSIAIARYHNNTRIYARKGPGKA
jgi:Restriction endonuclease